MVNTGKILYLADAFRCLRPVFSHPCCLCLAKAATGSGFCSACWNDLPRTTQRCSRCALGLRTSAQATLCGQCLRETPSFDRTHAPVNYEQPIDFLITQFKYHAKEYLAKPLAELMLSGKPQQKPDWLIPMPMHRQRHHQRGQHHSLRLATTLARHTRWPVNNALVIRRKATSPQVGMSPRQRRRNVQGAFACIGDVVGAHVVVVDDVMTTGSTAESLASTLKAAGAARVELWLIARAQTR